MARLAMKPNPITTITPARITDADEAISFQPRRSRGRLSAESAARRNPMCAVLRPGPRLRAGN
jgi:hypothetical protein